MSAAINLNEQSMKTRFKTSLAFLAVVIPACLPVLAADLSVTGLRCEYAENPPGVDVPGPRLFWKHESATRGQRQTAYQILAAASLDALAKDKSDLWDSGKVASDASVQISYRGQALKSSEAGFLESARVGQGRQGIGVEPAGVVDDGAAE